MKKNNSWIAAGLLTIAMFIATIYSILMYRESVLIIGIVSILFLASAFWLFYSISKLINSLQTPHQSVGEEQRERMNYEGMKLQGEELIRLMNSLGKGTYVNSKRTAEYLEELVVKYSEAQAANERLVQMLIEEQTKTAKFQVKYNQNDTGKVIAAMNDQCSRLNDSLSKCLVALQSRPSDMPQDNAQVSESLHTLSLELARINSSIQALQMQLGSSAQPVTFAQVQPQQVIMTQVASPQADTGSSDTSPVISENTEDLEPVAATDNTAIETETYDTPDTLFTPSGETETPIEEPINEPAPIEMPAAEPVLAKKPEAASTPAGNGMLDQAAIDALLSGGISEPEPNVSPVTEPAPTEVPAAEPEPDKKPVEASTPASNGMLDQAAIDALLSGGISEPEQSEEPMKLYTPTTAKPDVTSLLTDDPNKQLSADEIAALFAALG